MHDAPQDGTRIARIDLYLDNAAEPFRTVLQPEHIEIDTTAFTDGAHTLRLEAHDVLGNVGRRSIPFVVQNGPGITVTGLRADERVVGTLSMEINAFGGDEPFDPIRAESSGPIPAWTWIMAVAIFGWAGWYALANFGVASAYAATPTYEANPIAMAQQPMTDNAGAKSSGGGTAAGFDYAAKGEQLYTANCSACHGATGAGVPGAFPPLAGDPVVTAKDPTMHLRVVLHGLHGVPINGKPYSSQMPPFPQLSDEDIASIVDHERTSWGNNAPTVTPDAVKKLR
jgi:mono/diheme cytochrome c family protein